MGLLLYSKIPYSENQTVNLQNRHSSATPVSKFILRSATNHQMISNNTWSWGSATRHGGSNDFSFNEQRTVCSWFVERSIFVTKLHAISFEENNPDLCTCARIQRKNKFSVHRNFMTKRWTHLTDWVSLFCHARKPGCETIKLLWLRSTEKRSWCSLSNGKWLQTRRHEGGRQR